MNMMIWAPEAPAPSQKIDTPEFLAGLAAISAAATKGIPAKK